MKLEGVKQTSYFHASGNFPKAEPSVSIKNFKKPLDDLSFKGFSFMYKQVNKVTYDSKEVLDLAQKYLGKIPKDLFENLKSSPYAQKMFKVDEKGGVTFFKKTVPQLLYDGIVYPIKILPADILNGIVGFASKFSKKARNLYQSQFFKNIRQRSKIDSKVNSMRGIFESVDKLKGKTAEEMSSSLFQTSVKRFDEKVGNYDTKHERSLNRIVSGLPPAIFLANDAYNLSRSIDDDAKGAEREKKTRFKQEASRIGLSAYLTLITMGALQKYINNSKFGIMLMTGSTVLVTEMFSRLSNGKHITKLTPEKAQKINEEKGVTSFSAEEPKQDNTQKPLLTFSTVMKASAVVIAAGFGIKGLRKVKSVDELFKKAAEPFKKLYKKMTTIPDYSIPESQFNQILKVLKENGFEELAQKYSKAAKIEGGRIKLGAKDKKVKPFVNFVIAPFKFAYNFVTLPYRLANKAVGAFKKKPPVQIKPLKDTDALAKSIETIGRQALKKDFNPQKFKDYVSDNILKAFNIDNMSNISNSDLSNLAKTSATAATIWFLMTDNYNMVMLKSNGKDKDGAEQKFKERFVQEGSRLFYQTLLIDLFNNTFKKQYNGSLLGMTYLTLANTTLGEMLTRKSVGMSLTPHTQAELIALDERKEHATGFAKKYYNFMTRLTGKRKMVIQKHQASSKPSFKATNNATNLIKMYVEKKSV